MGFKEICDLKNKNNSINKEEERQRLVLILKVNNKGKKSQIWESFSKRGEHSLL